MASSETATATLGRTLPDHDRCDTHQGYKLSCEQYERLLARSRQLCEICQRSLTERKNAKLNIDHSGPKWAVRGLLCTPCNTTLRNGTGWLPGAAEYLARTWWLQECARLGLPSTPGAEPVIGGSIRDQYLTVWIRQADGRWHPYGGRKPPKALTWDALYGMRGPQNLEPFDVSGPGGNEMLRFYADKASYLSRSQEREAAAHQRGRLEFARELLAQLSEAERDYHLKTTDLSDWQDENYPPQTDVEHACSAVEAALNDARCDWDYLANRVEGLLKELPDGVGERSMAYGHRRQLTTASPGGKRTSTLVDALYAAEDFLQLPAALKFMDSLTGAEQAEWRLYARSLWHRADLDEDRLTVRGAHCARTIAAGNYWAEMCVFRGEAIPACPELATHCARISELSCCSPDGPEAHKGHRVCERHLQELVDGTHVSPKGLACSTKEYAPVGSPAWDF